jgi:hypothetical protein
MTQRRSDTIRVTVIGLAIGCLTLTGCGSSPTSTGGSTDPSPSSAASGPSTHVSRTGEPATPTSAPPQTAQQPAPAGDAAPIGPDGIGQLLLGMSYQEAKGAGFVRGKELPGCASYDMYLGGERYGLVYISPDRGVEAIGPERPVHTPEDVAIGTKAKQVAAAYPDFDASVLGELNHVGVKAPGHPDATYRLEFDDRKVVTGIGPQRTDQDCYE